MAYFEGNAIYVHKGRGSVDSGSELQLVIDQCKFMWNYGLNSAYGAAVSIDGKETLTVDEADLSADLVKRRDD